MWNFRFANVVGSRLRGAVIPDFIEKLRADPSELIILGNGDQQKSYLYIDDCVDAITHIVEETDDAMNTFNLGTDGTTSVTRIADIVSTEMGVDPEYDYTGGDRGGKGDIPKMRLAIDRLRNTGWSPEYGSDEAVRLATRDLIAELD